MTLPAHRFLNQELESELGEERGKGGKKSRTWTFDYDETITKSPDRVSRLAQGLSKLGDRIVVLTGNKSPRGDLLKQLDDWKFPYDDLVQYSDDQTDGINRLVALQQLDAWGAFDDRAGRAPTLVQQCPHFFLCAMPSKAARKQAKAGDKKKVKKAVKKDARSEGEPSHEVD